MERIEKLLQFLSQSPSDNFLQHALALEYIKHGKLNEAKETFEALLNRDESYIGSYYHLAKLLEQLNQRDEAIKWYEKGLSKAREAADRHAYNELQAAYEEIMDQ